LYVSPSTLFFYLAESITPLYTLAEFSFQLPQPWLSNSE